MRILFCGNFSNDNLKVVNGQVTKTRNLFNAFKSTNNCLFKLDTYSFKKRLPIFIFKFIYYYFKSNVIALCVSRNGSNVLLKFLYFLSFLKKKKILYYCVGTCPLPKNFDPYINETVKNIKLKKYLCKCTTIFAETKVLKESLEKSFGLNNVDIFENFQFNKTPVSYKNSNESSCLNLVYFSRICDEKNVFSIFEDLEDANFDFKLDFYGPIDDDIKDIFLKKIDNKRFFYKGVLPSETGYLVLKEYDALIFTTSCLEGTPGCIIDAYFAGLPVISNPFWAAKELIIEPNTGVVNKNIKDGINELFFNISSPGSDYFFNSTNFSKNYTKSAALVKLNETLCNLK